MALDLIMVEAVCKLEVNSEERNTTPKQKNDMEKR